MDQTRKVWNRRQFIQTAGSTAAIFAADAKAHGLKKIDGRVSIVVDPADAIANSEPCLWAIKEFDRALAAQGTKLVRCKSIKEASADDLCIVVADSVSPFSVHVLRASQVQIAAAPESLGLVTGSFGGRRVLLAAGHDSRAIVYALLELVDRVQNSTDPVRYLTVTRSIIEQPANQVRSITRLFTSDAEDKPWYNDREMWQQYLTMLATNRFNRFNLAFGIGYDFITEVTDAYFLFTYPFLLSVPGYNVRVPQLPDAERDNNLAMLRFISEQTVARGMQFSVGLWMHGYEWINSPNPNYTIEGLTQQTHGPYCRDALRMLLKECPAISGVTFRIHGESGVAEGSYDFWKTVFEGVATCGRKIGVDMHAKGMDETMIDIAVATRQPVSISPKYWAEHMGMSYHQTDIRAMEQPKPGNVKRTGLMKLSAGSRSFLRYGYGDLLRNDRKYTVVHRIWPGTQRLLIWGDPITGASYSRAFSFCGSNGVEICEPLSFKGRRGSGHVGDRCAYADPTLSPKWDWQKYLYSYRIWGRLLYNPDADPAVWQRFLQRQFGSGASNMEMALANASRILPIVTTGHAPSAGNNNYWPEIYLNHSMIDAEHPGPYTDSPSPKVFGNVSPLDPQLFSRMSDFATDILTGERDGKYSPVEVAQWLEDIAEEAQLQLTQAEKLASNKKGPEYRRMALDISLQIELGKFFGAKFRSGTLFEIYKKTNSQEALKFCLEQYRKAREIWTKLARASQAPYMSDITVGEQPQLRGDWLDRLPAIDEDIGMLAKKLGPEPNKDAPNILSAIQMVLGRPFRVVPNVKHDVPKAFHPGEPLKLSVVLPKEGDSIYLYYRHVDQAERFVRVPMERNGGEYTSDIPSSYTASEYPLQYYFEVKNGKEDAGLYPGFAKNHTGQPYFIVLQT